MILPAKEDQIAHPPLGLLATLARRASNAVMAEVLTLTEQLAAGLPHMLAGAWLMTRSALARLYPGETPRRGEIRVELSEAIDEEVAGVIASVAGLVTGAANEGGFKGIAGHFARNGLLRFGVPTHGEIRFTRLHNGRSVELSHRPQAVPRPASMRELLRDALAPQASTAARRASSKTVQEST